MTQNTQGLPNEIADVYEELYQDICWLHAKWKIFRQLYSKTPDTVELLNKSAPSFFRLTEDMLVDDVLLTISRLTDPKQTFKRDNLTLERLASYVDDTKYPVLKAEIEQLLIKAKDKCGVARELRNRRIAHSDLPTKLKVKALPTVTVENIEEALSAIRDIMNKVEGYFQKTSVSYEDFVMNGDGDTLIACLREAEDYRKQHRKNLGIE